MTLKWQLYANEVLKIGKLGPERVDLATRPKRRRLLAVGRF